MDELSRLQLYNRMIESGEYTRWIIPLRVNVRILTEIESYFLTQDRQLLSQPLTTTTMEVASFCQ